MNFYFYSPIAFEKWDFRNPETKGIGGSETSHIEMALGLAKRGHKVISYTDRPKDCPKEYGGVIWKHLKEVDFKQKGIWVMYRCPADLDKIKPSKSRRIWFIAQDSFYEDMTKGRASKLEKFVVLCKVQGENEIISHPYLKGKVIVSSNGIKCPLIREIEQSGIKRNPHKLIWTSSPDRGLKYLLETFKRSREFIPDLRLDVFYGFNNIDQLFKRGVFTAFKQDKKLIMKLLRQPGVHWHGRVNQRELYKEWFSAGIWCYQTNFGETSCITCMEAQAMGAVPITHPIWALKSNIKNGILIEGDAYEDPLTRSRYVGTLVNLADNLAYQEQFRNRMMLEARTFFNWERFVDQWEAWALEMPSFACQYNFQYKNATGKVLNVGCDEDAAGFRKRGAINVDIISESPITHIPNPIDILADARDLPEQLHGKFDSVILGDILEHMDNSDIVNTLNSCKKCLKPGGKIIITSPEDYRPMTEQHQGASGKELYADNIPALHARPMTRLVLESAFMVSNLEVKLYQPLDYGFAAGHAYVIG